MPRRTAGLSTAALLLVTLACACAPSGPPPAEAATVHIDTNTPQGVRAKQTADMLNSDWPIDTVNVGTLVVPQKIDDVTRLMDMLWRDRPITVTGVDVGAGHATLHVRTSYAVGQDIELRTDDTGLVDRFDVTLQKPRLRTWRDVDAELAKSGARYSYQAARVTNGTCTPVAGTNVDQSLPIASMFKLYVLLAVADAVNAGTLGWDDGLTITADAKAVGSAAFANLAPGAQISVRAAAQQMISASDNVATDLLIAKLGPGAVEHALAVAGHHDPAAMTPFPTTHDLFSIGWGKPDMREQWKQASPTSRGAMLAEAKARPYEPDPERTHTPASPYGVEWYASASDICRVHAALQVASTKGPAAPVRDILSATPGIDLDKTIWRYVASKAGNLPGDMTFSWYAEDRTGQGWVVSFQLNWPIYRSLLAATWLLSVATQAFGLLPAG